MHPVSYKSIQLFILNCIVIVFLIFLVSCEVKKDTSKKLDHINEIPTLAPERVEEAQDVIADEVGSIVNIMQHFCESSGAIKPDSIPNYSDHIGFILEEHCVSCHNSENSSGSINLSTLSQQDLDLHSGAGNMASLIGLSVSSGSMPPAWSTPNGSGGIEKVDDCLQGIIETWISYGAPYSAESQASHEESDSESESQESEDVVGLDEVLQSESRTTYLNGIKPLVDQYCASCHSDALNLGGLSFAEYLDDAEHWNLVLQKVQEGAMPPESAFRDFDYQSLAQIIEAWISDGRPYGDVDSNEFFTISTPIPVQEVMGPFLVNGRCELGTWVELTGDLGTQRFECNNFYSFIIDAASQGPQTIVLVQHNEASGANHTLSVTVNVTSSFESPAITVRSDFADACMAGGESIGSSTLSRLTKVQYMKSIESLFAQEDWTNSISSNMTSLFASIPNDSVTDGLTVYLRFAKTDKNISTEHVLGYSSVASYLSTFLTSGETDSGIKQRFFGSCFAEDNTSNECASQWINDFTTKVWRSQLSAQELSELNQLFQDEATPLTGFRNIIYYVLMSPEFLFHLEHEGSLDSGTGAIALSTNELMAKISYLLADIPPDQTLLSLAANSSLNSGDRVDQAVDHLLQMYPEKVRETFNHFLNDWLGLSEGGFVQSEKMRTLVGSSFDLANQGDLVKQQMMNELYDLFHYYTFDSAGSFSQILTSNRSFARNQELANLYGVPVWDGASMPPDLQHRYGFLTLPAILANGNHATNPFGRGGLIYKHALCQTFPGNTEPPMDLGEVHTPTNLVTTRQQFESVTPPASSCFVGCHQHTNPYGFVFEDYNPLGIHRQGVEKIINLDGQQLGELWVDSIAEVNLGGQRQLVNGAAEFITKLNQSQDAHVCFARQYFRFAMARFDQTSDSCALNDMHQAVSGGSVMDMMRALMKSSAFTHRNIN